MHPTATYLCLDPSRAKLLRFRSQRAAGHAVRGDGAALPLRDRSVDLLICKYVFHHLSDEQLGAALGEFRRVVRGRLLVMDAIKRPGLNVGNALWMLDEGDYPRSLERNYAALDRHFDTTHEERFRMLHHYFIRVCRPRA